MHFTKCNLPLELGLLLITFLCLLTAEGQYETANNLCGGFFRTNRGSINFRFNAESVGHRNKVCVWTIIPPVPFEYTAYTMNITTFRLSAVRKTLAINGFKERTNIPQSLSISGVNGDFNVDGPLVVIVLRVPTVIVGQGFDLNWRDAGEQLNVSRLTTTYHSWSQSSVAPLPYFATGFMRNQISTFAFPKGNNTEYGYVLQIHFDNIQLDEGCETLPTNPVSRISCDFIVALNIGDNGILTQNQYYSTNSTGVDAIRNENGFYLIVWSSDEPRGGGKFQMRYSTVR